MKATLFLLLALHLPLAGHAQSYPSRPIRVIIGQAAGGGTDIVMRSMAPKLSDGLGQQVVIENKTGASGIIAADLVAKAQADGHTLLMAPSGVMVGNVVMKKKLPYSVDDFTPVSLIGTFPMLLVVNSATPARSLDELVKYIRANPRQASSAGSGYAFELQTAALAQRVNLDITFVPFRGANESVQAVASKEVLMTFSDVGPAFGAIQSGLLRPLAVTSPERLSEFPDVPTFAELGFPELQAEYWMALFAPANMPRGVSERISAEVRKALADEEVRTTLKARWVQPWPEEPQVLRARIQSNIEKWTAVRKAAKLEQVE
ncbi:MAG: Bug family tripartite tricarboxylate transporter substrate binding protein [Pigmentiphaga sp.]|uniref:Bug family tripartite tricarboxylate transporter substrate binding protein n=1 Tax=Pigmentiphaga sp. TaxID=1977564 RepID=UPI003B55D369